MKTAEIKIVRGCISLLNSMIRGGENHSATSQKAVSYALEILDNLSSSRPTVTDTISKAMIENLYYDMKEQCLDIGDALFYLRRFIDSIK